MTRKKKENELDLKTQLEKLTLAALPSAALRGVEAAILHILGSVDR